MKIKFLDILNEEQVRYPFNKKRNCRIKTKDNGDLLLSVEVPTTTEERLQGAMFRESLCEECGILFNGENGEFHMRNVNFPLDMVFISEGRVVDIKTVNPEEDGITSEQNFDQTLEVNGGFCENNGVTIGDEINFY
jgi:uncharacterized membrane protein (UPF0127 family)